MNKKQKIFSFSMILLLLLAISVPVDAAAVMRTTVINTKITAGHVINKVFLDYPERQSYTHSELSPFQLSEINKFTVGRINTDEIKFIELDQHLTGSDDRPIILSQLDDTLVITSVDDENKKRYGQLIDWAINQWIVETGETRETPSPFKGGSPGDPFPELMWYTPTLNDLLINKTTLNQARFKSLESDVFKDHIIIRADVLSIPTPSPTPPGFELLFAIIGVLAAVCLVGRRGHV